MKATFESTEKIIEFNGLPARVWEGVSENGVKCCAFITRVMVHENQDSSQFEKELQEHKPPSAEVRAIPLKMIL